MGLSKLSKQCRDCPFADKCKNKRMEALAYMTESNSLANAMSSISENLTAPLLRETTTIMVNGTLTKVYKDEIEKQLYSGLGLSFGVGYYDQITCRRVLTGVFRFSIIC